MGVLAAGIRLFFDILSYFVDSWGCVVVGCSICKGVFFPPSEFTPYTSDEGKCVAGRNWPKEKNKWQEVR
jgi:hypothetical protein